ncbi:MAG: hypothetical protein LJF30_23825 [Acidobacteria bacterium]|nr:hypothetical protein [Acidobacteriota bacterium]
MSLRVEIMEIRELIEQIERQAIVSLDREELSKLLAVADTIRADDTGLAGWIRVLLIDGRVAVQEQTTDGEILLRRLVSRDAAEQFVDRRLADYERMWDGCGCRIDYRL